eukprot:TRINITY_DN2015_c0_g1_i2.p1 TRINITY_DN2015_c0_g1~~TRINITY_DN2015_c0_g1_i2.p1  ORF type:complete len:316 (+),score=32.64 TRINITY_DN2015_c0_g1_i2:2493-3440(+)
MLPAASQIQPPTPSKILIEGPTTNLMARCPIALHLPLEYPNISLPKRACNSSGSLRHVALPPIGSRISRPAGGRTEKENPSLSFCSALLPPQHPPRLLTVVLTVTIPPNVNIKKGMSRGPPLASPPLLEHGKLLCIYSSCQGSCPLIAAVLHPPLLSDQSVNPLCALDHDRPPQGTMPSHRQNAVRSLQLPHLPLLLSLLLSSLFILSCPPHLLAPSLSPSSHPSLFVLSLVVLSSSSPLCLFSLVLLSSLLILSRAPPLLSLLPLIPLLCSAPSLCDPSPLGSVSSLPVLPILAATSSRLPLLLSEVPAAWHRT